MKLKDIQEQPGQNKIQMRVHTTYYNELFQDLFLSETEVIDSIIK